MENEGVMKKGEEGKGDEKRGERALHTTYIIFTILPLHRRRRVVSIKKADVLSPHENLLQLDRKHQLRSHRFLATF